MWVEAWIPRDDPLWAVDVAVSAAWVGAWWGTTLGGLGLGGLTEHQGPAVPGRHGKLVCFSGRGPGELFFGDRKVMGVSQWRSREGSLFHTCAYTRWDPSPLIDLFDVDGGTRDDLRRVLPHAAIGLAELGPPGGAAPSGPSLADMEVALLSAFATWGEDVSRAPA
jgi:hypothetical protein